tara:strand:+ start:48 stop:1610 length:1563 start_codon:yes stop_codon:yes gene_type:complete
MSHDPTDIDRQMDAGSLPSIVTSFGIRGLYGYRNISLESDYAATILIARNGSGKTTLLAALDAFLRKQFFRLRELPFTEIFCTFRDYPTELVLRKEDLEQMLSIVENDALSRVGRKIDVPPGALFKFITEEWPSFKSNIRYYSENKIFYSLVTAEGHSVARAERVLDDLASSIYQRVPAISALVSVLDSVIGEYEIVYLPTYRRVELALSSEGHERPGRRRRPRFDLAAGSIFTSEIQFGLTDISERLEELNNRIVNQSNNGYRKISANIINDLLDGSFDTGSDKQRNFPSREDLDLFFSRLEDRRHAGPYTVSPPNLDRIYSDHGIPPQSLAFLHYFLSQLDTVIDATREVERSVEDFVESCNKYLSSYDPSADVVPNAEVPIDAKQLVISRKNLKVSVESIPDCRKISLDALSSGEKQMISLFAKLYLYQKPKIVLIDEPELSLSIDWQRHILLDIVNAPLCRQVVAITHSPFVFDNELEPYARSIRLSMISSKAVFPSVDDDIEDLFGDDFRGDIDE